MLLNIVLFNTLRNMKKDNREFLLFLLLRNCFMLVSSFCLFAKVVYWLRLKVFKELCYLCCSVGQFLCDSTLLLYGLMFVLLSSANPAW